MNKFEDLNMNGSVSSEILLEEKWQRWKDKLIELSIPDNYGYVIESGVIETIAALQLLGINTRQSCEGDYSDSPWIEFGAEDPENIYVGEEEIKIKLMDKYGIDHNVIDKNSPEFIRKEQVRIEGEAIRQLKNENTLIYTGEFEEWQKETADCVSRLQGFITDFYENRNDEKNIGNREVYIDFPYCTPKHPLYIQDIPFLRVKEKGRSGGEDSSGGEYEQNMIDNKNEMKRFTEFLKEKFFKK
ncbi:MAG: hypothetical protein ACYCZW_01325 [Minisyncoccota bacterium]